MRLREHETIIHGSAKRAEEAIGADGTLIGVTYEIDGGTLRLAIRAECDPSSPYDIRSLAMSVRQAAVVLDDEIINAMYREGIA